MSNPEELPFKPYHEDNFGPWISNAGNTLYTAPDVPDAHMHDAVMVRLRDRGVYQNYLGRFTWDAAGQMPDDIIEFRFLKTHPHYAKAKAAPIDPAALAANPLYGMFG